MYLIYTQQQKVNIVSLTWLRKVLIGSVAAVADPSPIVDSVAIVIVVVVL
jgi:hypothetical protein